MKNILLLTVFMFVVANSFAQKDTADTYTENIVVVGSFDPVLSQFQKISTAPTVKDSVVLKKDLKYSIFPQIYKTTFETKTINPAKMSGEPFDELFGNYIKVGAGTAKNLYGELFLNNKRDKKKSVGLHLKHNSMNGKIKNYGFTGNSENLAEVYGSMFRKKSTLQAAAFYERDVIHYYGFNPEEITILAIPYEKNDYKQVYSNSGLNLKWQSANKDSSHVNYKLNFSYNAFWDFYKNLDHNILLSGQVDKMTNWFKFAKFQTIGLKTNNEYAFSSRTHLSSNYNGGSVNLTPFINAKMGVFFIELGVNAAMNIDSNSSAKIYPHIMLDLDLLPGTLTAFGGYDGCSYYNSYINLVKQNPFIHYSVENSHSLLSQHLFGGIRGNIGKAFGYSIKAEQKILKNYSLFINNNLIGYDNYFTTISDNVNWFRASFDATLNIKEKWNGRFLFAFNQVDAVNEVKAWHIPQFEAGLGVGYNLKDKIMIDLNIMALGKRYAKTLDSLTAEIIPLKLKPVIDANLKVEYRYTKALSAFVQFNNIAAQRYMIWNNYPSYRFQFFGGVTFSF